MRLKWPVMYDTIAGLPVCRTGSVLLVGHGRRDFVVDSVYSLHQEPLHNQVGYDLAVCPRQHIPTLTVYLGLTDWNLAALESLGVVDLWRVGRSEDGVLPYAVVPDTQCARGELVVHSEPSREEDLDDC